MTKTYLDTETCGLHGFVVLIQYAVDDGPITLYEVWKHSIGETLALIEWLCEQTIVGFNLSFDWFHIAKCYTVFRLCPRDWFPEEHIDEIALKEDEAKDGPCLKPAGALDLLLHSRKGPYQSLMAREDIRIRRVPAVLADSLAEKLEELVQFDGIYFAKRADKNAPRWNVFDRKKGGKLDADFKDVCLRFSPAGGLKFLAEYVLGLKPKYHYKDVEPQTRPLELGYAPIAAAISQAPDWAVYKDKKGKQVLAGCAWPGNIKEHINHWHTRADAREYAQDDVVYTRALDAHFGHPQPNDADSILACMVAAVRWHGFKIDIPGIQVLLEQARATVVASPINCNKPPEVRRYIYEGMDEIEIVGCTQFAESTKKANLEAIAKWKIEEEEECGKCSGVGCSRCHNGTLLVGVHPAAQRAKNILGVKIAAKEVELYTKLLRAKRLHASFKVIGTLSSRMSGADGLNPQGIKHTFDVRSMFPLAWEGMVLGIGDFDSFEVTIADAVCNDSELRADLLRGVSIHGTFGTLLFPGMSYEEVCATKKTEDDRYTKAKQGFFATILYGGTWETLLRKLGVPEKDGKAAIEKLLNRYRQVKAWRERIFKSFCSMAQPGGIGSRVVWNEPSDYVETFLGFRRYFTLENRVCKALFDLAQKPPKEWRVCNVKVVRRNRVQTAGGAVSSALYAAAFSIQAAAMRAAANHQIQSPGAEITKRVQRDVWELQPCGIHPFHVALMQVHDEIACVSTPEMSNPVAQVVKASVESFRPRVPLIGMEWKTNVNSWGEK